MQLWMGFSKFLNFPQVPNVSNEVGPWFSLETRSSTTHATYSSNQNCMVPLWPLEGGHVSKEYFLPAAIFKKMYQFAHQEKKGELLCQEELQQYSNFKFPFQHKAGLWSSCKTQGWWHGWVHVPMPWGWWICHLSYSRTRPKPTNQHWWLVVYFEGKEEGYLLFNSMGGILSLFVGVRPLPLFKE